VRSDNIDNLWESSLSHLVYEFEILQSNISGHFCARFSLLVDNHFCGLAMVRGSLLLDGRHILRYLVGCLLLLFLVPTWSVVQGESVLAKLSSICLSSGLVMLAMSYEICRKGLVRYEHRILLCSLLKASTTVPEGIIGVVG
jgi:hypothetical protein